MVTRVAACALLLVASCLLLLHQAEPAAAQGKDGKKEINQLEKQLKAAQADLNQAAQQIAALKQENNQLRSALKKDAKEDEKTLKTMQSVIDGYRGAGLVHVVVLKAKPDTKTADIQLLIDESYSQLKKIKPVRGLWTGKPSANPVMDAFADYTVALVLIFDDAAGLKSYFNDPVHLKFMEKHLKNWEAPVVYDFEPRRPKP